TTDYGLRTRLLSDTNLTNETGSTASSIGRLDDARGGRQIRGVGGANHVNEVRIGGAERQGDAHVRPTPAEDVFRILVGILHRGRVIGEKMRHMDVNALGRLGRRVRAGARGRIKDR